MRESPLREIYLELDGFGARLGEYMVAVRWLGAVCGLEASRVDAYFDAARDRALLRLRFVRPSSWEISALAVWAHCEGFRLLEPDASTPERYRDFHVGYLPGFALVERDCGRMDFALVAVAQSVRAGTPLSAGSPPARSPHPRAETAARGTEP